MNEQKKEKKGLSNTVQWLICVIIALSVIFGSVALVLLG